MLDLYKNIKKFRLQKSMSQQDLANKTGYTDRSSIAKIEKGEVDLPQSKIMLFAQALDVSEEELMGDSHIQQFLEQDIILNQVNNQEIIKAYAERKALNQLSKSILDEIVQMDIEELRKLLDYAKYINKDKEPPLIKGVRTIKIRRDEK